MTIPKQFKFEVSEELKRGRFDDYLYFAERLNENKYKITWEEDGVEQSTTYLTKEIKDNLLGKYWVIRNN